MTAKTPIASTLKTGFRPIAAAAVVLAGMFSVLGTMPVAQAAPQPAPVPQRWQLDVEIEPLRTIVVPVETTNADGSTSIDRMPFLYATYTVVNHTGSDLLFAPRFEAAFDNGRTALAGDGVPTAVTRYVLDQLENPLLKDQVSVIGNLGRGLENAREGLVVWPLEDLNVDEITVYAAGFSGETTNLDLTDPESGEPVRITLRKTLVMRFATPGTIDPSRLEPFERASRDIWQMR